MDESHWERHLILVFDEIYERPMQPFPANSVIGSRHGAIVGAASSNNNGIDVDDGDLDDDDDRSWRLTGVTGKTLGGRKGRGGRGGGDEASPPTITTTTGGRENEESRNDDSSSGGSGGSGNENGNGPTVGGTRGGSSFFFRPGAKFAVSVWEDGARTERSAKSARPGLGRLVGRGHLTLGSGNVYVDSEAMNFDPYKKVSRVAEWRYEFDQIGKEFD